MLFFCFDFIYFVYISFLNSCESVQVAVDNNDPEMCDFIEREYLYEQVLIYFSTYHHEKLRPVPIYFGLDKAALKYDFRSHDLNQLGFLRSHSQINYCECILR